MNVQAGHRSKRAGWALAALLLAAALSQGQASAPAAAGWRMTDTTGKELTVPAKETPTLLLFLRPGQGQSEEAARIAADLAKGRPLQVIVVVSGDNASGPNGTAARLAAAKLGGGWPVVPDETYASSGRFEVRVWPTTVLVNARGEQTAHLAGLPVTFANDLAAHLDFASGKIDRAALEKALANREVVGDSEAQKAARHVEVALRLAEKGMYEQALAELAKAVELKPTDGHVQLAMARVYLITGDAKSALALVEKIPAGQFPPGEINTLKGWAAVQTGDWAAAKSLLTLAVKLNPNPGEALYLLGRVAEQEKDLATAAKLYRQAFEHTAQGKEMSNLPK